MSIIKVKNINKIFGGKENQIKVLKNIPFEIEEGELAYLMEKSGSWKSTLSYLIDGLNKPTDGKIK